eukprot:scaffold164153_cov29-Tisochrysis_lutea.AAC.5
MRFVSGAGCAAAATRPPSAPSIASINCWRGSSIASSRSNCGIGSSYSRVAAATPSSCLPSATKRDEASLKAPMTPSAPSGPVFRSATSRSAAIRLRWRAVASSRSAGRDGRSPG